MRSSTRKFTAAMAGIAAIALLGGCAGADSGGSPTTSAGGGVAYGATLEEYQAAFADVEPITLKYQLTGEKDGDINAPYEAYLSAVEEWSDGKITFERGYSSSMVPSALEWAPALADGRLDLSYFVPYLTPGVFPELSVLANGTLLDGNTPTATLASTATFTEAIYTQEKYQEEADAAGLHLLMRPPNFSLTGYFCPEAATELDEFSGAQVSATGAGQFAQVTALGATPLSVAFTELYEALERGIVNCIATSATTVQTFGAADIVPSLSLDAGSGLADFLGFYAISKDIWDSLPLVSQQLLFDKMAVLVEGLPRTDSVRLSGWLEQSEAAGGGISQLSDDAKDALDAANEDLLAGMADSGIDVDALVESRDRWTSVLEEDLYPELPTDIEKFLKDGGGYGDDVDLGLFTDALYEQLLVEHRPS